jgi:hypothetical protein
MNFLGFLLIYCEAFVKLALFGAADGMLDSVRGTPRSFRNGRYAFSRFDYA